MSLKLCTSELHLGKELFRLCKVCLMKQDYQILDLVSYSYKIQNYFTSFEGQGNFIFLLNFMCTDGCLSSAAWKLHYYQWAMQIFEQYSVSEGACQFALAALEQVDEALSPKDDCHGGNPLNESAATIKGRLWANVFKFTLDLNLLHDAYCAIISNPDEESKCICLRRFIIVLYERKAAKVFYQINKLSFCSFLPNKINFPFVLHCLLLILVVASCLSKVIDQIIFFYCNFEGWNLGMRKFVCWLDFCLESDGADSVEPDLTCKLRGGCVSQMLELTVPDKLISTLHTCRY